MDAGIITITVFISPYRKDRESIRDLVGKDLFFEIYVQCPIDVCANRDQKGIYAKAKAGTIKEFTGISAPYESPTNPSLFIDSARLKPIEAAKQVLQILREKKMLA